MYTTEAESPWSQVHYAQGNLRQGWSLLQQALELAEPGGKPIPFVGTLFVYMSASQVAYERGELDQVEAYLTRCADQAVQLGSAEAQVFALSGLAHLRLAYDDLAAATNYFHQVDALLRVHTFNINIMAFVEYYRFHLLLKQGNFTDAAAWVEAHSGQLGPLNPYFHRLALPQIRIAQGDFETALSHLTTLIQEAQATGQGSVLIKALVLQALAFHLSGDTKQALTTLERALILAEPEGYLRTFVDEGPPMAHLLYQAARAGLAPTYTGQLLAAFPDSRTESKTTINHKPAPAVIVQNLIEPLSERELEVLQLITEGLSDAEIAQKLFLSPSTVKRHAHNIYGKLGVGSRTQAVARSKTLGILPPG